MSLPIKGIASTYLTYKLIRLLVADWTDTDAFKHGIIDADGNAIRSYDELTTMKEKESYTLLHRMLFNIKRILLKIPVIRTKIGTLATALFLLKEHTGMSDEECNNIIKSLGLEDISQELTEEYDSFMLDDGTYYLTCDVLTTDGHLLRAGTEIVNEGVKLSKTKFLGKTIFTLEKDDMKFHVTRDVLSEEDAGPVNAVSVGADVANTNEPVGRESILKPSRRHSFAGMDVFDVEPEQWQKSLMGGKPKYHKYAPYVGEDEVGEEIRNYARSNPTKKIVLRNSKTGSMVFLRK